MPNALYAKEAGNGFSGDYNDLTNTPQIPTVPTNVSAFTNDAGYITSAAIPAIPTVPTNVSAFTNDAGYITTAQVPAQVNADWNATSGAAQILNKPALFSGNYNDLTNKPVLFSGNYNDLTNKPTLFDGNYNSLTNRPNLAAVATSGNYNDLINKPAIPTAVGELTNNVGYITLAQVPAQVNADWNATSGAAQILNKPTLFSGNYNDLTNKPVLFSGDYNDLTNLPQIPQIPADISAFNNDAGYVTANDIPAYQVLSISNDTIYLSNGGYAVLSPGFDGDYNSLTNRPNLFSGSYNDLTDTPTIPTVPSNVSAFTNDAGYLTSFTEQQVLSISHDTLFLTGGSFVKLPAGFSGDYNDLTNLPQIPQIPADISAFNNDAGYITGYTETDPQFNAWDKDYNDLTNKPSIPTVPTNVSAFNNDAGYITGYTETDPQFNAWDKNYNDLTNKPNLFSGNYNDLTNKPTLFDGNYNYLINKPNLATVATTGNYNDLVNKPALFSGNYNDLTNKPTIPTVNNATLTIQRNGSNVGTFTANQNTNQTVNITVPTTTSQLTNNSGYITISDVLVQVNADWNATNGAAQILNKPNIPTNVSQLNNDAGYITAAQCGDVDICAMANQLAQLQQQMSQMQARLDSLEGNTFTCGTSTVTDHEGNVYATVQINDQCWMRENLRTTKKPDGSNIPLNSSSGRYYPNGNANNVAVYGYLYTWNAVMNGASSSNATPSGVQGICPTGWHVPSSAEWDKMTNYLSSQDIFYCNNNSSNIAKVLASTTGWSSSSTTCAVGNNQSANNATGFGALPAGYYNGSSYYNFGNGAYFWSATQNNSSGAYSRYLSYNDANVSSYSYSKSYGYSVRCLRD